MSEIDKLEYTITDMVSNVIISASNNASILSNDDSKYDEFIFTYSYQISTPSIATYETLTGDMIFSHVTRYPPLISYLYDYEDCPYGYSGQQELTSREIVTYLSRQRFTDGVWNFATSAACTPIYNVTIATSSVTAFYDDLDKRCAGKYSESIFTYTYEVSTPILSIFEPISSDIMSLSGVVCYYPTTAILDKFEDCPHGYTGSINVTALEYTTPLSNKKFIEGGWSPVGSAACIPVYNITTAVSTVTSYYNGADHYCHGPYNESILTYSYDISTPVLNIFETLTGVDMSLIDVECFSPIMVGASSWVSPCPHGYSGNMSLSAKTFTTYFTKETFLDNPESWVITNSSSCSLWPNPKLIPVPLAAIVRNNNGQHKMTVGLYGGISPNFNIGPQGRLFYNRSAPTGTLPISMGKDYDNIPSLLDPGYTPVEQTACRSKRTSRYSVITASGFENGYEPLNGLVIEGIYLNSRNDFTHLPTHEGYNMPYASSYDSLTAKLNSMGWWKGQDSRCYYELWATIPNNNTIDIKLHSIPYLHILYNCKCSPQKTGYKSYVWIRITRNGNIVHSDLHTATANTSFSISY